MLALAVLRHFVPIAADRHAAPPAFVRLGAVVEPQCAFRVFAHAHELEIAFRQQVGRGFGQRGEALFDGIGGAQAIYARGVAKSLPIRPRTAHKHSVGKVLLVAGSLGYTGAAIMTAQAAMRAGAGAVILCAPRSLYNVLSRRMTEVMVMPVAESPQGTLCSDSLPEIVPHLAWADVVVAGPGLGLGAELQFFLASLVRRWEGRLLLDADALTLASRDLRMLRRSPSETVLTPHVGEFSRLAAMDARKVERMRLTAPKEFARRHRVTIALKGAPTVVAGPDGPCYLNATGNPGMATAGAGDVLTGLLAGLWAQGMSALDATCAAVYLHGAAGDIAGERFGERGLLATDILEAIPQALRSVETAGGA